MSMATWAQDARFDSWVARKKFSEYFEVYFGFPIWYNNIMDKWSNQK